MAVGGTSTREGLRTRMRVVAASVVLAVVPVGAIAAAPQVADAAGTTHAARPAQAAQAAAPGPLAASSTLGPLRLTDYPTWDDVQRAQQDEKSAKALLDQLQAQLVQLQAASQAAQADAQAKGEAYGKAQDAYDAQDFKTQQLQQQADAAHAQADAAHTKAAKLVGQLSKSSGGLDSTATLLSNPGDSGSQLYRIQAYNQLIKQSQGVYERALQLQKSAQSLTDQANVEKRVLDALKQKAEAAFAAAQTAAQKAQEALAAEQAHAAQIQAQVEVLTQKRQATEADYQKGLVAQWGAGAAGKVSPSGWADPAGGVLLDPFGMRYHPIYHRWQLHTGQDIASACGSPIYSAHAGTVVYAGWFSDLGNYIKIDHGNGVVTGYGHIVNGGILVQIGQKVAPGQNIAKVGSTGGSTGCHLHFQTYVDGSLTDPVAFMRNQGVKLGS